MIPIALPRLFGGFAEKFGQFAFHPAAPFGVSLPATDGILDICKGAEKNVVRPPRSFESGLVDQALMGFLDRAQVLFGLLGLLSKYVGRGFRIGHAG